VALRVRQLQGRNAFQPLFKRKQRNISKKYEKIFFLDKPAIKTYSHLSIVPMYVEESKETITRSKKYDTEITSHKKSRYGSHVTNFFYFAGFPSHTPSPPPSQ